MGMGRRRRLCCLLLRRSSYWGVLDVDLVLIGFYTIMLGESGSKTTLF